MKRMARYTLVVLGLSAACARGPRSAAGFRTEYEKGRQAYQQGHPSAAVAAYREAIRLKPDSAEAHNDLAVALYDIGEGDAAIQEYQRALRLNQDYAEAHNNLGVAWLSTGQIATAVGEYRQAVDLRPEFTAARYNLCLGLELLGQLADALGQCRVAYDREPGRPGVAEAVQRLGRKLTEQ